MKKGELICRKLKCHECPISSINCASSILDTNNKTLYTILEIWEDLYEEKEIYDILKSRLDKEEK